MPTSVPAAMSPWSLLHPAEISAREFPRARKGFDPDAVRSWLRTVATAVETLQTELRHVRAERDRLEAVLRHAAEGSPAGGVRAALLQARLRRRPGGYDRSEVESLLESAAAEIARLESRTAVLEAETLRVREATAREASLSETVARLESEVLRIRSAIPTTNTHGE